VCQSGRGIFNGLLLFTLATFGTALAVSFVIMIEVRRGVILPLMDERSKMFVLWWTS
jgi:hypothetical protein